MSTKMVNAIMIDKCKMSLVKIPENISEASAFMREQLGKSQGEQYHIHSFGNRVQYSLNWNLQSQEDTNFEISGDLNGGHPHFLNGKVFITELEEGFAAIDDDKFVDIDVEDVKKYFLTDTLKFWVLKRHRIQKSEDIDELDKGINLFM